jgi:hypothetical protein
MMCAAVMSPVIAELVNKTQNYRDMLPSFRNPSAPLFYTTAVTMLTGLFLLSMGKFDESQVASRSTRYPVAATAFIKEQGLGNRVLADTVEASWLIHQGLPVFIDGRMDLYQDDFFFAWRDALEGNPSWKSLLDEYHPSTLLLENKTALRQLALASGTWELAYSDERFSVLTPVLTTTKDTP